jgi:hypothetical protein
MSRLFFCGVTVYLCLVIVPLWSVAVIVVCAYVAMSFLTR